MGDRNQWNLNDKIQYWKEQPDDKETLTSLFSPMEYDILETIGRFEILDKYVTSELAKECKEESVEGVFIKVEQEAEISLLLKKSFMRQMDFLLAKGSTEAWMEIIIWYSLLEEREFIIHDYWEFSVLNIMIYTFVKELNAFLDRGEVFRISILSLHDMEELIDTCFRVIFLCRRVEYGIEPMKEIVEFIKAKKLSDVFVSGIVEKAQIYNKDKVIKTIEEWG